MQRLLIESNVDLLAQCRLMINQIDATPARSLLAPYTAHVRKLCGEIESRAAQNLKALSYNLASTFEAILSNTQLASSSLDLIGSRFSGPILRGRPEDDLMLAALRWLHEGHPKTKAIPFAISDGGFAVYPSAKSNIYFLPASRQVTLLYIPLFFHEFGHVLYECHKPEMDDLVKEFQRVVATHATPATIRDRPGQAVDLEFRNRLVVAWYPWAQEFFCDAIGLAIGGPSYLKSFSHYLRMRSKEQYYRPRSKQLESRHPVTVLRTRVLADRARMVGLGQLADAVEKDWNACAKLMKVNEDFEGTWADELLISLRKMLDDMVEEISPLRWTDSTNAETGLLKWIDAAWNEFDKAPHAYSAWERTAVSKVKTHIESGGSFDLPMHR